MKSYFIISLLFLAFVLICIGALFKIVHVEFGPITGNMLLITGMGLKIAVIILLIVKIRQDKKIQNLIN